jgi:hypothetical protein
MSAKLDAPGKITDTPTNNPPFVGLTARKVQYLISKCL